MRLRARSANHRVAAQDEQGMALGLEPVLGNPDLTAQPSGLA